MLLWGTFALTSHAQVSDVQVPLDPQVRRGVLSNGLTYYIRHNEWPEKRVDFYIAQKVGSMQEEDDQRGLAHFLEHMCFNGTKHFPGSGLKQYLEGIGVQFGEDLNAYTSFDETVYNINNVNVEVAGAIDSCLCILHDWSHDLLLQDSEIDKERGVINEEWRVSRSAMLRMYEKAFREAYPGSRYADRMVIGTMDVVMNFPYETLRSYYRRWYRPDLQGIVIVGDVDVDQMESKIKAQFADIEAPAPDAPQREYYPVPDNDGTIVSIQKDKEQTRSIGMLSFKMDPVPREMKSGIQYQVIEYLRQAVSDMMDERIEEMLQQADAPFIHASLAYEEFLVAKTKDALQATVLFRDNQFQQGLAAIYREVLRAQRFGFTPSEYARFQQEYLSGIEAAWKGRDKVKNTAYVSDYVNHFLDGEPAPGVEWTYETMQKLVPQIPLEAVNQLISHLPADNRVLLLFLPEKEGMEYPTPEQLTETLSQVEAEDIQPYAEEVNTDPLVSDLPATVGMGKITDDVYGAKLLTLPNGIRVHLLSTDYTPNEISMASYSWGGSSLYTNDEYLNANGADMVSVGGWGNFTALQLQKRLAGIQASMSPWIGDRSEGLSGSCVKKDFETLLQLLYLCHTAPHRDDETFRSTIERYRASLADRDLNPMSALSDSVARIVYGGNVRALRLKSEDMSRFDYDRITQIYNERFANAADFEYYFVGDFQVDSIAPLIARYIGALPYSKGHERYRDIDMRMTKGQKTCIFDREQDTPNAKVQYFYHTRLKDNLRNELMVSMLNQALDILFTETVREDEGGTYGVSVDVSLKDWPEQIATARFVLPTSPAKMQRMMEVIDAGLQRYCQQGPSEDVMSKVKQYMARSHEERLKSNGYWIDQLYYRTREGKDYVTRYDATLQSITARDMQKLCRKLFQGKNRIIVGMKTPGE